MQEVNELTQSRPMAVLRESPWLRYKMLIALGWTLALLASLLWNLRQLDKQVLVIATRQAEVAFETNLLYRRWNAGHGGVYVPVTPQTQPNPYLDKVRERDLQTPAGRQLTLMNPAYMMRQFHELAQQRLGIRGHITSLNPLRPQNASDPWEEMALRAFEKGQTQITDVQTLEGIPHLRYMRPLKTEASCLLCHAHQGYKEGDIRGGISVGIPLPPIAELAQQGALRLKLGHLVIWLVGLTGLVLGAIRMRRLELAQSKAEQELRELNAELEQRVQLRTANLEEARHEMEAFTDSVSHDLRAPLRRINGFIDILKEELGEDLDPHAGHAMERISASTLRMDQLIEALLQLSRCSRGELQIAEVDTRKLVEEVLLDLKPDTAQREVRWTLGELPVIRADRHLLRQVFLNLLGNALKFTRPRTPAEIRIGAQIQPEGTVFTVQDNGVGFDRAQASQLFGVFQRLHSGQAFEGTGVGLAMARRIIQRHQGRIWAEAALDQGATFSFLIPDR